MSLDASVERQDQLLRYWPDDHTLQAQTGLIWGKLLEHGALHHQGLPLIYPNHWTLYSILSADWPSITTGLAGRYPRDYVLGLSVADGTGLTTKAGGRVMKNVTGYDVCRLMVGSHNSLATITEATLKLTTLPKEMTGYWVCFVNNPDALAFCEALRNQHRDVLWACEIISTRPVSDPESLRVFVLSIQSLPITVFGTFPIETLSHEDALQAAAQLSSFAWEGRTIGEFIDSEGSRLSGVVAVSLGTMALAAQCLEHWLNDSHFSSCQWQYRPAAGLLLFSVSLPPEASLQQWETLLNTLVERFPELQTAPKEASLRITQWPQHLTKAVDALHLPPPNTPESLYYQRLKQLYDPQNQLQSPHLPLHLLSPPIA
jgi:hypothetical protein